MEEKKMNINNSNEQDFDSNKDNSFDLNSKAIMLIISRMLLCLVLVGIGLLFNYFLSNRAYTYHGSFISEPTNITYFEQLSSRRHKAIIAFEVFYTLVFFIFFAETVFLLIKKKYSKVILIFENVFAIILGIIVITVLSGLSFMGIQNKRMIISAVLVSISIIEIYLIYKLCYSTRRYIKGDASGLMSIEESIVWLLTSFLFLSLLGLNLYDWVVDFVA